MLALTSSGIVTYNPEAKSIAAGKWWIIMRCCEDLGDYYLRWYNLYNLGRRLHYEGKDKFPYKWHGDRIYPPAWGFHISVVTAEEPPNKTLWDRQQEWEWEFQYDGQLRENGEYVWMPVVCNQALDFREELGLSRQPFLDLHLTIGRYM